MRTLIAVLLSLAVLGAILALWLVLELRRARELSPAGLCVVQRPTDLAGQSRAVDPHSALGGVVRRLDAFHPSERPEGRAVLAQILRDLACGRDKVVDVPSQKSFEPEADRSESAAEPSAGEFSLAEAVPLLEERVAANRL